MRAFQHAEHGAQRTRGNADSFGVISPPGAELRGVLGVLRPATRAPPLARPEAAFAFAFRPR